MELAAVAWLQRPERGLPANSGHSLVPRERLLNADTGPLGLTPWTTALRTLAANAAIEETAPSGPEFSVRSGLTRIA